MKITDLNRHKSRSNFKWVLKGYKNFRNATRQQSEIFVLLGGSRGMLPHKILKFMCLRLAEVWFPNTYFEGSFISHSVTNCCCNWRLIFSLNFHCQRHFDDCLTIFVLRHFDKNYEPGSFSNCAFFRKI